MPVCVVAANKEEIAIEGQPYRGWPCTKGKKLHLFVVTLSAADIEAVRAMPWSQKKSGEERTKPGGRKTRDDWYVSAEFAETWKAIPADADPRIERCVAKADKMGGPRPLERDEYSLLAAFLSPKRISVPAYEPPPQGYVPDRGPRETLRQRTLFRELSPTSLDRLVAIAMPLIKAVQGEDPAVREFADAVLDFYCRMLELFAPVNVSREAQRVASESGIGIADLRTLSKYEDRDDLGDRKKEFMWEHHKPCKELFLDLTERCGGSETDVLRVIQTARIAWILAAENKRLSHRDRADPERDYKDARIELLHCWTCAEKTSPDGSGYCTEHQRTQTSA